MILTMTPFAKDMNLGRAYNDAMSLLGPGDWACLLDHDVMFTTYDWNQQLEDAIAADPRGSFTGVTNRIHCPWQQAKEAGTENHDIKHHRRVGAERLKNRDLLDVTSAVGWGGFLMLLSYDAWDESGGFVDGMLCVDHQMHFALRRAGRPVYLIEGLYMYHYKRALGEKYVGAEARRAPIALDRVTGQPCPRTCVKEKPWPDKMVRRTM